VTRRNRWFWLLAAVIILGASLRLGNLLDLSRSPFFTRPITDGQVYDQWAVAIRAGKSPAEPFYQDPLYPYFLALVYAMFGHSYWAVYLLQLIMGVVLIYFLYDIGRRLFDPRAGIVAALLGALYKPFYFYEVQIEKTAIAVFLSTLFIWAFVRSLAVSSRPVSSRGASSLVWPIVTGLLLGLAALTRANMLIFAPVLPVVYLLAHRPVDTRPAPDGRMKARHRPWLPAVLSLTGVMVVIAPVAIRNSIRGRELILTTTQGGQNLYIGNSPYNQTGQYEEPPWVRPNPRFEQADFRDYAWKAVGHKLGYAAVSDYYSRAAIAWGLAHPHDFMRLLGRKFLLYFNHEEVPDNQDLSFFGRYSWVLRLPLLGFGIVFALGFAGMLLDAQRTLARWSLLAFFTGYAVSAIAFFILSRYRLPAVPVLLPFAGGLILSMWDGLRRKGKRVNPRRLWGGLLVTAICGAVTAYPLLRRSNAETAGSLANLAVMYCKEGDTAKAIATLNEALQVAPGYGEALLNLGEIAYNQHDINRAYDLLVQAAQAEPTNPFPHYRLGQVWELRRSYGQADAEYRRALALAPGRVEYRFSLGTVLQKLDSLQAAIPQYDTLIALAPDDPLVRHNYAVALYGFGRFPEAMAEIDTMLRLGGQADPQLERAVRAALAK
jgi:tetratricopeptide (TPR) repeat protein